MDLSTPDRPASTVLPDPRWGFDFVYPGLWIGGAPPEGPALADAGFTDLALTAQQHQPSYDAFPRLQVHRALLRDDLPQTPVFMFEAAERLAEQLLLRFRALPSPFVAVTCQSGFNRSGLVVTMLYQDLTGCGPAEAIARVQAARRGALHQEAFRAYLLGRSPRRS